MTKKYILCADRHEMPADAITAIFPNTVDPTGVMGLEEQAEMFFSEQGISALDTVGVYVTGLTVALVAVINVCRDCAIPLVLYHYNRETGTYFKQEVLTTGRF